MKRQGMSLVPGQQIGFHYRKKMVHGMGKGWEHFDMCRRVAVEVPIRHIQRPETPMMLLGAILKRPRLDDAQSNHLKCPLYERIQKEDNNFMLTIFYMIVVAALAVMIVDLVMVFRLRSIAPGGTIGKVINILIYFIFIFMAGYAVAPFMPGLPLTTNLILVALIYLFGAVFVAIVLWLLKSLIEKVVKELGG
jgi:hypothetical protein